MPQLLVASLVKAPVPSVPALVVASLVRTAEVAYLVKTQPAEAYLGKTPGAASLVSQIAVGACLAPTPVEECSARILEACLAA